MTSLVDVTFVLLIIFIISTPLMRSGMKVDLPRAVIRQPQSQRAILITIDRNGQAFVNGEKVAVLEIGAKVSGFMRGAPDRPVLIEGDTKTEYGKIVAVMDMVRQAGIENVGLVLEAATKKP